MEQRRKWADGISDRVMGVWHCRKALLLTKLGLKGYTGHSGRQ